MGNITAWLNQAGPDEKRDVFEEIFASSLCWMFDSETNYIKTATNVPMGGIIMVLPVTPLRTAQDRIDAVQAAADAANTRSAKKEAKVAENDCWNSTWDDEDGYFKSPYKSPLENIFRSNSAFVRQDMGVNINCRYEVNAMPGSIGMKLYLFHILEILSNQFHFLQLHTLKCCSSSQTLPFQPVKCFVVPNPMMDAILLQRNI